MADQNIKPKITYSDVADFFLAFGNDKGEMITNLKLQKLVYYAQAWFLANFERPLFDEDFQAWVHGPVIPNLYDKYKGNGSSPIVESITLDAVKQKFPEDIFNFLNEVASVYMPHGAYELESMTHKENPWIDARKGFEPDQACDVVIPKDSMQIYYGQRIKV